MLGAYVEDLLPLQPADAVQLLAKIAGESRVSREPATAAELCALCGHLALAVRVIAARLFQSMLAGEDLRGGAPTAAPPVAAPRQGSSLPRGIADFTGREWEIGRIVEALGAGDDTVCTTLITGPVGCGKTALAVHVAQLTSEHFPDGQFFISLRGDHRRLLTRTQLWARIGAAVGLDFANRDENDIAALWRRWLSGQRALVILDDVRQESIVRTLLPPRGASRVLITSRYRLSGLDAVLRVELGELHNIEALELIAKIAGIATVLDERDTIESYLGRCGRLPLVVRIIAGRVRQLSGPAIRTDADLLEQLVLGDLDLASLYEEHCAELPVAHRQVLAAIAARVPQQVPPLFDREAIADLIGHPMDIDRAIEALVEAHLLQRAEYEVTAHADTYMMLPVTHEYARSRLCAIPAQYLDQANSQQP